MSRRKRKITASGVIAAVLGFMCALTLAVLFYGAMVYQLAGEGTAASEETQEGAYGALALTAGAFTGETTTQERVGGALCTVITRTYQLADGTQAQAVTATPAAYLERLAAGDVSMQLITGFAIDGLDAAYALTGEGGLLAARQGDTVYMVKSPCDQQTLYELGALARRDP